MDAHPNSAIQEEIVAALRKALTGELAQAKAAGTLSALDQFASRHPRHPLGAELAAARRRLRHSARSVSRRIAQRRERGAVRRAAPRVRRAGGAEGGDSLPAKVSPVDGQGRLERGQSPWFMGQVSKPSRYFDDKHLRPLEIQCGSQIAARFAQSFPEDMLDLKVGEPLPEAPAPFPNPTVPTLFIDYAPEWIGTAITSDRPRGIFATVGFGVETAFRLPPEAKPLLAPVLEKPEAGGAAGQCSAGGRALRTRGARGVRGVCEGLCRVVF